MTIWDGRLTQSRLKTYILQPAAELYPDHVDAILFDSLPGGALTATPVRSASTTGQPAIGQIHSLTALAIKSAPATGRPTAAQANALTATGLSSTSTTGRPAVGQKHDFDPLALKSGATTGRPTAGIVTITYDLIATALASEPTTGKPALAQVHALAATAISTSSTLGRPAVYVGIGITATPIVAGTTTGMSGLRIVSPAQFIPLTLPGIFAAPVMAGASTGAMYSLRSGYTIIIDGYMPTTSGGTVRGSTKLLEVLT